MEIYVLQYELRVASFIYSSLRLFIYSKRGKRGNGGKGEKGGKGGKGGEGGKGGKGGEGGEGGKGERGGEGQRVKVHVCINIVVIIR